MEEIELSDDVIEQIKDFKHNNLTEEQELLIDKLILNEELKNHYKNYGLCKECKQPNTGYCGDGIYWCQSCNGKRFQQNFQNWTSGNHDIDELIQRTQLKAKNRKEVIEWIEYDRFENIEYLAKGGFGTTYKATWKDGFIRNWDSENNQWKRDTKYGRKVALKCLHNSQNITVEFLNEVRYFFYNF
jgi:ribosomal protein L37AE/L43A